jgi:hypothetical protein
MEMMAAERAINAEFDLMLARRQHLQQLEARDAQAQAELRRSRAMANLQSAFWVTLVLASLAARMLLSSLASALLLSLSVPWHVPCCLPPLSPDCKLCRLSFDRAHPKTVPRPTFSALSRASVQVAALAAAAT